MFGTGPLYFLCPMDFTVNSFFLVLSIFLRCMSWSVFSWILQKDLLKICFPLSTLVSPFCYSVLQILATLDFSGLSTWEDPGLCLAFSSKNHSLENYSSSEMITPREGNILHRMELNHLLKFPCFWNGSEVTPLLLKEYNMYKWDHSNHRAHFLFHIF